MNQNKPFKYEDIFEVAGLGTFFADHSYKSKKNYRFVDLLGNEKAHDIPEILLDMADPGIEFEVNVDDFIEALTFNKEPLDGWSER